MLQTHLFWCYRCKGCIKARFLQPGCRDRKKHRATYFKFYKWIRVSKPTKDVIFDYSEDINHYRFSTQLQIFKTKFVDSNEKTVSAVINYVKKYLCANILLLRNNCSANIISCVVSKECCRWRISFFNASH